MQISNKPIRDWKKILIDTSIICALFRSQANVADETTVFIRKLIDYLSTSKSGDNADRIFCISTITLSELLTKEHDQEKIRRILKVLNSSNVQFVSFDTNIALKFNIILADKLHRTVLNERAASLGWKTGDFMDAREWIIKDYMIAMTATEKNIDVILTADKNTFYPLTGDIKNCVCILTYPVLFKYSEQHFFEYDYNNVGNFINKMPFQTLNEIEAAKPKPVKFIKPTLFDVGTNEPDELPN